MSEKESGIVDCRPGRKLPPPPLLKGDEGDLSNKIAPNPSHSTDSGQAFPERRAEPLPLDSFDQNDNQPCFGAGDANGQGRMELHGDLHVKVMGAAEISSWLNQLSGNDSENGYGQRQRTGAKRKKYLDKLGKTQFKSPGNALKLGITLKFTGPFLVNDPFAIKKKKGQKTKTDHFPLLDHKKIPRLPVASFRGVLRTQAERIIRTLGGKCCNRRPLQTCL